jgi:hypothetical protein
MRTNKAQQNIIIAAIESFFEGLPSQPAALTQTIAQFFVALESVFTNEPNNYPGFSAELKQFANIYKTPTQYILNLEKMSALTVGIYIFIYLVAPAT